MNSQLLGTKGHARIGGNARRDDRRKFDLVKTYCSIYADFNPKYLTDLLVSMNRRIEGSDHRKPVLPEQRKTERRASYRRVYDLPSKSYNLTIDQCMDFGRRRNNSIGDRRSKSGTRADRIAKD